MEDILLTALVLIIAWQWGDWKHWKQYYPTILFWALGNFLYLHLTISKPLWKFTTIIPTPLADIFMSLLIFPCTCLLYLPYFPAKGILKKFLYISFWVLLFSFIEWWSLQINHFTYFNSWKFTYSVIFNFVMFPLLQVHYKTPPWAWIISFVVGATIITIFNIPIIG